MSRPDSIVPGSMPGSLVRVFVYGTLKPGGRYHQKFCAQYLVAVCSGQIRGQLYDLPDRGYPAAVWGDGWVQGYLLTLRCQALAGLDWLEGYSSTATANEYERCQTEVFDPQKNSLGQAWVYVMTALPQSAQWLPGGCWSG